MWLQYTTKRRSQSVAMVLGRFWSIAKGFGACTNESNFRHRVQSCRGCWEKCWETTRAVAPCPSADGRLAACTSYPAEGCTGGPSLPCPAKATRRSAQLCHDSQLAVHQHRAASIAPAPCLFIITEIDLRSKWTIT